MTTIPTPSIAGLSLGEKTFFVPSCKRMTWIEGQAIAWNKKRTAFYLIVGCIGTHSRMSLPGGCPEAWTLLLTPEAREAILEVWRAGRLAWCEENLAPGFHRDERNGGYRRIA